MHKRFQGSLLDRLMKAVGFDLGETLIFYNKTGLSWEERYPEAIKSLAQCGIVINEGKVVAASNILRKYNTRVNPRISEYSCEEIFSEIIKAWNDNLDLLEEIISTFFNFFQEQINIYSDTIETLKILRQYNIPVGILTDVPYGMNSRFVREDLERVGIDDLISVVITSVDTGVRKPEADGFNLLADALHTSKDKMIFVGNERKDIEGANLANIFSVLLNRDKKQLQFGQKEEVHSLSDILRHVLI